jgi:hypothetical protein
METGITRYGTEVLQVPAIDKAGRSFSIAFTVALLYTPDNKVSGIAAVIRDDTKRFEKDRAQRKRISELESLVRGAPASSAANASAGTAPVASAGCPMHAAK